MESKVTEELGGGNKTQRDRGKKYHQITFKVHILVVTWTLLWVSKLTPQL